MTTTWTGRTVPTTTWGARTDVNFIVTQALDFLMTESSNYIVDEASYTLNTQWATRPVI